MQIDKILLLQEAGDIAQATIFPVPERPGKWQILLRRNNGNECLVTARRNNVRHFASTDSAIKLLGELGICSATVSWSEGYNHG
ncbi:MAG: hypothetical protein N0E45_20980 [Candidatus Thiodiazotropha endolucinida]|nr:hypothetical protein [Candidatus Thiodiazotropha taylori]MCG8121388.1 hypothetical protein [Candidatus Thiodiazotropha taylori]MCW4297081.1 hypothetical protein [Candidatus Thiodiazotropha endolucinida]MCW4302108.1 hypothetical protein [Candidatus Thiodiazotropha endolucinida]